jgi:hypothetical protein
VAVAGTSPLHGLWTREFAGGGDFESALEARQAADAICEELGLRA